MKNILINENKRRRKKFHTKHTLKLYNQNKRQIEKFGQQFTLVRMT